MSDMKCPFCNKKLEPIGTSGQFQCGTWGCDASFNFIATRDVWEYIDRTRKTFAVAVRAIETIKYSKKSDAINLRHKANKALIEIYKIKDQTAQEQKK